MKLRMFFGACVLGMLTMACGQQRGANEYILKGKVTNSSLDGQYIYLVNGDMDNRDSVLIENGAFQFRDTLSGVSFAYLYVGELDPYMRNKNAETIVLEPAEMEVTLTGDDFSTMVVTGSKSHSEYAELNSLKQGIMEQFKNLQTLMQADSTQRESVEKQMEELQGKSKETSINFIKQHPASFVSAYELQFLSGRLDYEELKALYDALSEEVKKSPLLEGVKSELIALENVQPGRPAPDFTTQDINGEEFTLSSLKGKTIILDFWASWCIPCRKSNPHLKAVYEKYKDKGLAVVCVSDDDSNPDKWREAVEKDGIEMFHHVLRGLKIKEGTKHEFDKTNDISQKYAIHFLPTKYLIGADGNIIGKMENEEMIDAKLKELFGE